jgi:hypothetical protein
MEPLEMHQGKALIIKKILLNLNRLRSLKIRNLGLNLNNILRISHSFRNNLGIRSNLILILKKFLIRF